MTASASTVKDQELVSFGLVESASVNSIADFIPTKLNESELTPGKENDDFANTFICHLIFYAVFCISLVLHILIDLGLGSFINKKFSNLIGLTKKTIFKKEPAFA